MKNIDFEKVTWRLQDNPLKSKGISPNVTFSASKASSDFDTLPVFSESYDWAEKFHRVTSRLRLNLLSLIAFGQLCYLGHYAHMYLLQANHRYSRFSFLGSANCCTPPIRKDLRLEALF